MVQLIFFLTFEEQAEMMAHVGWITVLAGVVTLETAFHFGCAFEAYRTP
jgi:multidrug transporter EmrE-like cation transporter